MEEVTFPNEVWLNILKRIDIPKLMELRLVCNKFYNLIEYLLNKTPEWKELCHETIMYECLEMTMQRTFPYVLVTHWTDFDDPVLWRGTYLSYKKWQKVLVNPQKKDTIVPSSNFGDISCVCTFDKYITISFYNGLFASYTIDNISQPFYLANHGTSIIQVEFWYSNGDVLVVTVGNDYALKFWDLKNKIEITTDGFFANSINSGECRHFCIGDMSGILTSYERVGKFVLPGPTLNLELTDDQQLMNHIVDGRNMTAMIWDRHRGIKYRDRRVTVYTVLCLYQGKIRDGKLVAFEWGQKQCGRCLPTSLQASLQRLTMPTNTFFFGIGENCIGSTSYYEDIWNEYRLGQHFGCNVISIALHAHIMMFGLENGSIHLLNTPHYGHVRELEWRIKYSKKIEVDTEPIVDLTVLEIDMKPCIVAVTNRKVHLINFF